MPVREAEEAAPEPGAPVPVREAEEEAGAANSAAPKWVSRARRPGSDTTTAEGETRPWTPPAWWWTYSSPWATSAATWTRETQVRSAVKLGFRGLRRHAASVAAPGGSS